jgi:hypothetical protein
LQHDRAVGRGTIVEHCTEPDYTLTTDDRHSSLKSSLAARDAA